MSSLKTNPAPRFVELASVISDAVAKLERILSGQGVPWPSFDEDAPASLPQGAFNAQAALLGILSDSFSIDSSITSRRVFVCTETSKNQMPRQSCMTLFRIRLL
jgi:hypothetical protein